MARKGIFGKFSAFREALKGDGIGAERTMKWAVIYIYCDFDGYFREIDKREEGVMRETMGAKERKEENIRTWYGEGREKVMGECGSYI